MHYIVHCLDHEGGVEKRLANYDAHKAYLANASTKTVISGPLLADDNETMIGSLFLLEADSKEEVVAFNKADPFTKAGVWRTVNIHPFSKRVDNR
ncbi:YciI family protein [Rhizobium sp. P32RR-XVIII]|uniref:YciI family protein n=1 Tax=Rhizobium sp. P32RR-XVIII TaxID=2726738 RepID=UPI00145789F4|nr:YciI family protein [Rhizobium sp. P32RR-XVIII]NLS02964.1 YciI family protein [Rhizobium sp. P32RR-XVIII]